VADYLLKNGSLGGRHQSN